MVAGHVFISYSRTDARYVQQLVQHLLAAGAPIWVDHGLDHRRRWAARVRAALQECAAVVAVVTPAAAGADWVGKEIRLARKLGKPVVALLLDGPPLPALAKLAHQDVRDGSMPPAEWVQHLLALTGRRPRPPAPPRSPSPHRPPTGGAAGAGRTGSGRDVDPSTDRMAERGRPAQRQLLTALRAVLGRAAKPPRRVVERSRTNRSGANEQDPGQPGDGSAGRSGR
ncbi:MAG TPA: TIR domain-containing protein [Micromonosporaceae bacterium]